MRVKRIRFGALNIAVTPHPEEPAAYVALFLKLWELDVVVHTRRDEGVLLASCVPLDSEAPENGLTGEFHKFTEIQEGEWENLNNKKAASADDLSKLNIPENLKPNRATFRYFFFPKGHRLIYQIESERNLGPATAQAFLINLCNHPAIKAEFPSVSVTIEQEPEALERALALPQINTLSIHVNIPNPDAVDPDEIEFVEDLLRKQGSKSIDVKLSHLPGDSVKPDEQNQKLARVATSYGRVVSTGRDEQNKPITVDTSEHPIREAFDYDKLKKHLGFAEQMLVQARALLARIRRSVPEVVTPPESPPEVPPESPPPMTL